jgi:hypothetical protein
MIANSSIRPFQPGNHSYSDYRVLSRPGLEVNMLYGDTLPVKNDALLVSCAKP